ECMPSSSARRACWTWAATSRRERGAPERRPVPSSPSSSRFDPGPPRSGRDQRTEPGVEIGKAERACPFCEPRRRGPEDRGARRRHALDELRLPYDAPDDVGGTHSLVELLFPRRRIGAPRRTSPELELRADGLCVCVFRHDREERIDGLEGLREAAELGQDEA